MMEAARWRLVKQVFHDALEQPESDRNGFLSATCGEDRELRTEVEALLAAHEDAGAFLTSPTRGDAGDPTGETGSAVWEQLQRVLAGRYSLERELGRGGMAIVYLARDVALDRPVAVKVLPPRLTSNADHKERFVREARTAAGLSHPNIVPIHLVEERDGLVYFVMALVEGESLGQRVRRAGPLKPADVARLVQEVAWALAYAHGRGVIHRDIKPDNILIDKGSGRALVSDFGIARVTHTKTMSQQGEVLGTLAYMSPEQASAEAVIDGRADLYSLGVTAFFALTGRLPFDSQNPAALMAMHVGEPAPPVRSVSGMVPVRLAEAVDRCLAKDPAARYPTGEVLAEAIADAQLTRREIAPSVREFLGAVKSGVVQVALLAGAWMSLGVSGEAGSLLGTVLLVMLASVTPLVLVLPVLAGRGVVRAGLDHLDVAEAVASFSTARDANIEYEVARATYLADRFSSIWVRAIFLAGATAFPLVVLFTDVIPELIRAGISLSGLG
ncbi:MAG: serine/threonine protein kinase, partial [Gemmatimonadetes bacterium]|nr:serine/threonine protein kinase [Gemmatimonadota bacterium]